jgi:hypothetical protein
MFARTSSAADVSTHEGTPAEEGTAYKRDSARNSVPQTSSKVAHAGRDEEYLHLSRLPGGSAAKSDIAWISQPDSEFYRGERANKLASRYDELFAPFSNWPQP